MKSPLIRLMAGLLCAIWAVCLVAATTANGLAPVKMPLQRPGLNKFNSSVQKPRQKPVQRPVHELPEPSKPAIKVEKTGPATAMLDGTIAYKITVTSIGDATVKDAILSDPLPKGTTFVRASGDGKYKDGVVTWKLGDLKPNEKRVVQLAVTATEIGTIKNTATVRTTNTPPDDATVETVVKGTPAIKIEKAGPATAMLGGTIAYKITVTSTGNVPATAVTVSDALPKGTKFVKAGEDGMFKDGVVTWKLGDLKPKEKRVLQVTVTATEVGTFKNTATVRTTNTPPDDATVETVVKGTPAIKIEKAGPATAMLGGTIAYKITVTSTGNVPATAVTVSDALPKGTKFVEAGEDGKFKDGVVTWKLGDLKPKEKRVLQVTVTATEVGTFKNTATVRTTNTPPDDATVETVVKGTPAIKIEKAGPATAMLGGTIAYKITVTSTGNVPATAVTVSDALPKGTKFVKAGEDGMFKDGVVTWKLGDLKPKEKRVLQVTVTATEVGTFKNTATVRTTNTPPDDATVETVVKGTPAIKIEKAGPATAMLGGTIAYKITVTSTGNVPATAVTVSDALPKGTKFVKAGEDGMFKDGVVTWKLGDLKPKEKRVLQVTVTATEVGTFKNTAKVRTTNTPPDDATVETVVKGTPAIKIQKSGPATRFLGTTIAYEITVTSTGDVPVTGATVSDPIPKGTTFVRASDKGEFKDGVVTWKVGDLKPKDRRVFQVTVKAMEIGTVENTAAVRTTNTPPAEVTLVTVVKGIPAILLEVVDQMDPIEVGEVVIYAITVTNQGTAVGNNISIKALLPKELGFVLAKGPSEGEAKGQVVTYAPLKALQPKAKAVWYLHAKALDEGDVRFRLELTSAQSPEPILETESTNLFK